MIPEEIQEMASLKAGKIPSDRLKALVLSRLGHKRDEVLVRAGVGEDSAILDLGGNLLVTSSDPITGTSSRIGYLAVHVSCNDVAACGARPVGVQLVVLLPERAGEKEIATVMEQAEAAARELEIEIVGGHTEITSAVHTTVLCSTALGVVPKGRYVTSSGARPGDHIVITKAAGLEGTAIIASDFPGELEEVLRPDAILRARSFCREVSIVREALIASELGASAMHDVTEGGLYGALAELAEASGVGMEIEADLVPVRPETRAVCDHLALDPLGLISSGTLVVTAMDGDTVASAIRNAGVPACVVGRVVRGREVTVDHAGRKDPVRLGEIKDELWRFLEGKPGL